ncbi:MAG: hypothetical protein GX900_06150, partial [Clostridiaceae bacterium]|nr:hypothetical protein [Clostridiaceae bacterium]
MSEKKKIAVTYLISFTLVAALVVGVIFMIKAIQENDNQRAREEYRKQVESRKATPEYQETMQKAAEEALSKLEKMREENKKSFDAVRKQSELRYQALGIQDELTQWKKEIKIAADDSKDFAINKNWIETKLQVILSAAEDLMQENIKNMKDLFSSSPLEEKTVSQIINSYIKSSDDAKEAGNQLRDMYIEATKNDNLS